MLSLLPQLIHIFVVSKSILHEFNAIFKTKIESNSKNLLIKKLHPQQIQKVAELKTVTIS